MIAVLLALCFQDPAATPPRSPWDGFLPGSSITTVLQTNSGKYFASYRQELLPAGPGEEARIQVSRKNGDTFTKEGSDVAAVPSLRTLGAGLVELSRRKETLTVKGRDLACDVVTYREPPGQQDSPKHVTIWTCPDVSLPPTWIFALNARYAVPATAVRIEALSTVRGRTQFATLHVLDLHQTLRVGNQPIDCVELDLRSFESIPEQSTVIRGRHEWLSADIPGAVVRSERECGTTRATGITTTQLVEFKAIR